MLVEKEYQFDGTGRTSFVKREGLSWLMEKERLGRYKWSC